MDKVLIIGSKGFIGSHCLQYFSKKYETWGCDLITDYSNRKYLLVDSTISDFIEIFKDNNFKICINCSGAASVPNSVQNPHRDFVLNSYNVFKQLDAIRLYSPSCKYVNLSSAAVYGNPSSLPVNEEAEANPLSTYGFHKWQSELICLEYSKIYNIATTSARIFSAYGPGLHRQVIWDICEKALLGKSLRLQGTGHESRDFIHVLDICRALELLADKAPMEGEIYNIANGREIKINQLVDIILNALDSELDPEFSQNIPQGTPKNWCADIRKINQLGFVPGVSIEQGIHGVIRWIRAEVLEN